MPTNDTYMTYSLADHRYILTIAAANDICNAAEYFGGDDKTQRVLNSISRTIYDYIHSFGAPRNKFFVDYQIATRTSLREVIFNAMIAQLEAHIESGLDDLKKQSGVNIENGLVIDQRVLKEHSLCVAAKDLLANGDGEFNICYAGSYDAPFTFDSYATLGY